MKYKGLELAVIAQADACNYGEGFGNVSVLKKKPVDGEMRPYISNHALIYSLKDGIGWNDTPVTLAGSGPKKVVQFDPLAKIEDYPELDLMGYLRTAKKTDDNQDKTTKRSAVLRLDDAVAMDRFDGTMDFINNIGLASRIGADNNLANVEIQNSFFTYSACCDLDRVGEDTGESLDVDVKIQRVNEALTGLEFLYRDCKGKRQNLSPLFVIGGVYERKNPFFQNKIKWLRTEDGFQHGILDIELLKETMMNATIADETLIGSISRSFKNADEVKDFAPLSVHEVFEELRRRVEKAYREN